MNSKFKRLLACLLSLMMVVSLFPMSAITAFAAEADEITTVFEGNVAKVGNTEYATIDEAIAAWTNGTTLTLLSNVTLSDVIKLSSTEYHTLDLGTYTMTAASKKDAIQIVNNGRSSASYTLDIKADATNPGGITASGKTVVVTTGKSGVKDRPIIRFYNGVFNASYVVKHSGSNGTNCPQFQFHGGVFNGTISTNRALNQFYGGTFTGSMYMSVDSSAYTLVAGGTFKNLSNTYGSTLNSSKFTIGSAKGVYDKEVYIDDNGNYVIAAAEPAQGIEAAVAKNPGTNDYLAYSKVATEGVLKYTDATMALKKNNTSSAKVTIYAEELDLAGIDYKGTIVVPEGKTLKITNAPEDLKVDGDVVVVKPVAKIGETSYNSLSDAIADATAGQTITFVADITEDVTINKAVTIDGAGKTYTGSMTLKADTTIKNVNFDGKGYNGYAVNTRGAQYLTIEDCTAKNYGFGFVQLASATALTTVKNVTASNMNYGVKVDYSGAVVLENVDITAGVAAILNSNYGEKTVTIKNSKLNILGTWTRNNTTKTTYVFEGANTIDSFITDAAIDTFKLAAGATLTAPNAVTVTTDVEDGTVVYEDGKYYVQTGLAGSGTAEDPYQIGSVKDLIKFRDSVNAGETKYNAQGMYFVLTADIDLAGENWVGIGSAYIDHGFMGNFDGNGFKIKNLTITNPALDSDGYAYAGLFSVTEGTDKDHQNTIKNLTIENVTISTNGHIVAAAIAYPYYTIVENVTVCGNINITGGDYTAGALAYTRRCVNASNVTVSGNAGSTITGRYTVGGVISDIQMNGGLTAVYSNFAVSGVNITGEKNVGGISGIISGQTLNGASVKSVALVCSDASTGIVSGSLGSASTITNVVVENVTGADEMIGSIYNQQVNVAAQIGDTYYATFDAAIKAAKAGDTISLYAPIVVAKDETVVIDLKGATIVGAPSEAKAYAVITNHGNLTIKDSVGGGAIICNHKLAGSTAYAVNTIVNSGTLTVEGGIIENKSTASNQIGYAIDNNSTSYDAVVVIKGGEVKASGSNYYDAIRLFCNNLNKENSVTVEGGKVSSIWLQNPSDGATKDTKDVKGSVTITGGTVDALYLEPSSAFEAAISGGYVGKVEYFTTSEGRDLAGFITGGTFGTDVTKFVADGLVVKKNTDGTYGIATPVATVNGTNYATLAEAIKAATAGSTITLLADVSENVTINKNLTIDGANYKYTGKMTLNKVNVTIENVNFVKGTVYKNKNTGATDSVVIRNCTFDGQSMADYAINLGAVNYITIENVTAKDYGYGLLQIPSSCVSLSVKNVDIRDVNYGLKIDYCNGVTLENVTIENAAVAGILDSNYGAKTYTVKNCKINSINIWERSAAKTTTFKFEGVNEVATLSTSAYAKYIGVEVDGTIYGTLADAFAAAQNGDTVKLLGNIATSETITIADGKKITLDMNGKKITVTDNATNNYELFYIYGEMIVTGDGTIELTSTNNRAWNAMSAIFHNRGGVLTIENGTFKNLGGTDMAWVVDNSGNWYGDATTVINGGTLTSTYTAIRNRMEQNTHGASGKAILVINGGTIDGTTSAIWAQAASTSTVAPATGSITVNGGNIGVINTARSNGAISMTTINGGTVASFKGETGELTVNGGKITGTITICHDNGDVAKYKVVKDGVYYAAVAKVGVKYYATLQEAIDACSNGGKVTLVDNAKGPGVVINKDITINFANYTYTLTEGVGSTGTESNGFQILAGNKVTMSAGTLKVAEEAADKFYILVQNYADLSCFNMNLDGTYLDKWSKTDGDSYVLSNNSGYISLTGKTYITTNNDGDKAFAFDACDSKYYADKPVVFVASTVKINGKAVSESYDKIEAAARIGSTQFFASLKEAFAYASNGNTIKLMADVAVSEGITNTKKVTLDLNGKTITGTDNATGSFGLITNKGQLTITGNGKITLTATNNRGWNAYSSVISNTVGGKLIVESGTIEHLGGTDMAYGIDNLTNGKGTYAETIIKGGTIKSTYRAIRMFLNGVEAQNILTINGGVVEGANKSVWMQDPSKNANTGNLTITKGAVINGDVYLTVTAGSTEWPVEVSIATDAVNGKVLTSNVPAGYKLVENKGVCSVEKVKVYIAQVGVTKYESLQAAIDACKEGGKVTLLCDAKGPGVVIDKNITILFNGHTYTITEPVGSAGTETLGFQILKGNKVVLNNGKIEIAEEAADKFAILIQNYADLTVYQMTLDGTNLGRYENYSYVLSVNCGKVTVNGKSVLTAKDGDGNYALDVYDYSSAGYSLPTVTVTSVVTINGKISAGAKYSTVYYATVEQAKAANPGKNVTVLN